MKKKIIIIGAGAAGIGMGIVLQNMEMDFVILEKGKIGESFKNWPPGTQFISPSFTGNFFGSPDLNAVCPNSSPAYTLDLEHPSGKAYAAYLEGVADFYELPIQEETKVTSLTKEGDIFHVQTENEEYTAPFVIWAGGEYQFPKTNICKGSDLGIHNAKIPNLTKVSGEEFAIIGGYESGFDTAIGLAKAGKKCVIFDSENHLMEERSDSSFSLSPVTKSKFKEYKDFISVQPNTRIAEISKNEDSFELKTEKNETFSFQTQPILATGFETSLIQIKDFFNWKNGSPALTESDESTKTKGLFLVGPQVRHRKVIFCFIYKFRQRFPIVAEEIAKNLGMQEREAVKETVEDYQKRNFYLSDLSCCDEECAC